MEVVYKRSSIIKPLPYGYCPGCFHGIVVKSICEVLEEMKIYEKTVCVNGVGCAAMGLGLGAFDNVSALHGRAAAVATGIKRVNPDLNVFTFQGDGDCASIGIAETIHAANRGEAITVIMSNNSVYGMTGGQMAPTSLVGQKTATCVNGRDPATTGYPLKMAELIATLDAPIFVARVAAHRPKYVLQMKKTIKKAFEVNKQGGFAFLEIISGCPTGVHMAPEKMPDFIDEQVLPVFKLGVKKDLTKEE